MQCHISKAIVRPYIFSSGKILIATPEHPVYVIGKGYTELQALRYCDTIETSYKYKEMFQWQRLLNLTALNIIAILNQRINQIGDISAFMDSTYIGQFGNTITVLSLKVIISTIRMVTRLIMTLAILSVLAQKSIRFTCTERIDKLRQAMDYAQYSLLNGTSQKRGANGIEMLANYLGKMLNQLNWYAETVTRNLKLWQGMGIPDFALMLANHPIGVSLESMMKQEFAKSVRMSLAQVNTVRLDIALDNAPEQVDVYNLTVETNEYFASDILVHNCDA
jgi:hypothetical protein